MVKDRERKLKLSCIHWSDKQKWVAWRLMVTTLVDRHHLREPLCVISYLVITRSLWGRLNHYTLFCIFDMLSVYMPLVSVISERDNLLHPEGGITYFILKTAKQGGKMPSQNCRKFSECLPALTSLVFPCAFTHACCFGLSSTRKSTKNRSKFKREPSRWSEAGAHVLQRQGKWVYSVLRAATFRGT